MSLEKSIKHRLILAAIGLLAGFFQYIFSEILKGEPNANTALVLSWAFIVIWAGFLIFTWDEADLKRLLIASGVLTLLYVLALWWVISLLPEKGETFKGDGERFATWGIFTFFSWFILLPFLGIHKKTGGFNFNYTLLFQYSWNNVFIMLIGGIVVGLIWALLSIWAGLFAVVGLKFFADFFYSKPFIAIATPTMFAFGVAMGRENDGIINTLLRITLTIFRALFPVLIFVVIIFFAVLPFTGLKPLFKTSFASRILFSLVAMGLIFINSVFQDGKGEKPYPAWMLRAVDAMLFLLPFLCGIALYSLILRVDQYGLSQDRFLGLVGLSIALAYSIGYAIAAGLSLKAGGDAWLAFMRPVNTAMALVIAAILLLIHTPVLDPIGHSARNQYNRLMDGKTKPDKFDYKHMLKELGRKGDAYVRDIEKGKEGHLAKLRGEIAEYRKTGNTPVKKPKEFNVDELVVLTPDGKIPPELFEVLKNSSGIIPEPRFQCRNKKRCAVFAMNVDDDPELEYIFASGELITRLHCYDKNKGGKWRMARTYDIEAKEKIKFDELKSILDAKKIKTVPARYRDLELDGKRYQVD